MFRIRVRDLQAGRFTCEDIRKNAAYKYNAEKKNCCRASVDVNGEVTKRAPEGMVGWVELYS